MNEPTITFLTCGGPRKEAVMTCCPSIVNAMQLMTLRRLASAAVSISEPGDRTWPDLHDTENAVIMHVIR